jgi:hypothetical protein
MGLPKHAPNLSAIGDCGRYPILIHANVKCIKYWLKLLQMPDGRYPKSCYRMLKQLDDNGRHTWATNIKELLMRYGFGHVWFEQGVGDIKSFELAFKQRAIDIYKQEWYSMIHDQSKLSIYCTFKTMLGPEMYVKSLSRGLVSTMARFRSSCHRLEIEIGRHQGILLENRLCKLCENNLGFYVIEDEYHFLLMCSSYMNERERYLPSEYRIPIYQNFMHLMSSENVTIIRGVALFIKHAMIKRQVLMHN